MPVISRPPGVITGVARILFSSTCFQRWLPLPLLSARTVLSSAAM